METIPSPTPERKKETEIAQSCQTLCDPMDCSLPGFSVHGIFQARVLSRLPFPSPGNLPNPGIEHQVSHIAGRRFTLWATREAPTIAVSYFRHVSFSFPCSLLRTYIHFWSCTVWSWTTETKKNAIIWKTHWCEYWDVTQCLCTSFCMHTQSSLLELQSHTLHWTLAI